MANIEIYTTALCPYCLSAKRLLERKGLSYQEYQLDQDPVQGPALIREMVERAGRRTVPQIFINGHHVGGSDDLLAAERSGNLENWLTAATDAVATTN